MFSLLFRGEEVFEMIVPGHRICKEGYVESYDIELIIKDEIVSFALHTDEEEIILTSTVEDVLKTCEDNVVEETSVYLKINSTVGQ